MGIPQDIRIINRVVVNFGGKQMKIAIAGTGYVGLSNAVLLSQNNEVIAVDLVKEKVEMINKRLSPIADKELEEYLKEKDLNLSATTDGEAAYKDADFVVVSTPTNYDTEKNYFDTSSVESVIAQVTKLNPKAFIVIKSTIPVGFTEMAQKKYGNTRILFSPEFLRESKALYDNLFNVNLLIIDDLGTENLTAAKFSEIFTLLNARLLTPNTKTIISTNFSLEELSKMYDTRIVSRLIGNFNICRFFGEDIRLKH